MCLHIPCHVTFPAMTKSIRYVHHTLSKYSIAFSVTEFQEFHLNITKPALLTIDLKKILKLEFNSLKFSPKFIPKTGFHWLRFYEARQMTGKKAVSNTISPSGFCCKSLNSMAENSLV